LPSETWLARTRPAPTRSIFGFGTFSSLASPQLHVLRNHSVGKIHSGASSALRLASVMRTSVSSGVALAYSTNTST
jgi:hypothetical protein